MEKYLKISLVVFSFSALALVGTFVGYNITVGADKDTEKAVTADMAQTDMAQTDMAQTDMDLAAQDAFAAKQHLPSVINSQTKMIYEYVYPEDGIVETSEEIAPYFLQNMDEDKLAEVFADWNIISFSPEEVIMRKEIAGKSVQHYVVGINDGYIAVFYQEPVNGMTLKEVTGTLVSALNEEEQERLARGVMVTGDEELVRVLEDYCS